MIHLRHEDHKNISEKPHQIDLGKEIKEEILTTKMIWDNQIREIIHITIIDLMILEDRGHLFMIDLINKEETTNLIHESSNKVTKVIETVVMVWEVLIMRLMIELMMIITSQSIILRASSTQTMIRRDKILAFYTSKNREISSIIENKNKMKEIREQNKVDGR